VWEGPTVNVISDIPSLTCICDLPLNWFRS
jgi:hypothetical protein